MRAIRLAVLSGILIGTSYIPFPPWAIYFCLVPLWIQWLGDPSPRRVFLHGWVTQFVLTLIGFNWVAYTAVEFGHLPWPIGGLVLVLFSALFHWHVPAAGVAWALIHRRWPMSRSRSLWFFAFAFAFFESVWPMIFPWNLGYTWLWGRFPAMNWADVIGFQGLSSVTALINAMVAHAWLGRAQSRVAARWITAAALILAVLNATALGREKPWRETDSHLRILAVQANIGNLEKFWAEDQVNYQENILKRYIAIANRGLNDGGERPDFLFFPETAIPINLDMAYSNHYLHQHIMEFFRHHKIPVVTGAYSQDPVGQKVYNAFFLFDENGEYRDVYRKSILLAFGEYFPGAETFPFLKDLVPAISDFGHGPGAKLLDYNGLKIGPQICYEGLYANHSRELSKLGAEVFFNATNDSWYGTWSEPYQHLYMTLARAVEFRRPLMRVTNTGITTGILADGTVLDFSPFNTEWTRRFDLPYKKNPPPTLYERFGKHLSLVLLLAMILTLLIPTRIPAESSKK
ncbi:MAG TPA: apolipoprotein N-acyltransferase [Bdellovibrionales bacterium]|nr:apolipoprotein N-acyltransferase [Bdellovibrionales bacterium]